MKKLLSSLLCFAMVATLTACGGGRSDTTLIRAAVGGDMEFLDPAIVDDSITANVLAQMYEGLYKLDKDGQAKPNVAKADPVISDDGLTYTIELNSGYKWSDGQPLTAKDYIYAWRRATSMGIATAYYSQFINKIEGTDTKGEPRKTILSEDEFGAKATNDTTIVIKLKEKCAYFGSLLTNTVFYPMRQDIVEKDGGSPLKSNWADRTDNPTNGAFRATAINVKDEVVMEKNKEYHAADEVKIEKISFKVMKDSDSQTQGFSAGDLDWATSTNVEQINSDDTLKNQAFVTDPFVCNYYVLVNAGQENTVEALKDTEIRKALSYAMDRQSILTVTGYGEYAKELDKFIPAGIPGANGDYYAEVTEKYATYDLAKAQEIMKSKGYNENNMLKLEYKYNDLPLHKSVAESMQASLKKAYIDLKLTVEEKETFFKSRDNGKFELARHAMTADFLDPMCYLSMYYGFSLAGNTVDDKKYEEMITAAEKMTGADRMNALHAAEKYLVQDQAYIIPLFSYVDPYLKASDLQGITSSPEGHYDLTRAYYK